MRIFPEKEEARRMAEGYRRVPVAGEMPMDGIDPAACFLKFKRLSRQCFILESLEDEADTGRYTFIGYDPQMGIACKDGALHIDGGAGIELATDDPGAYIRKVLADNRAPRVEGLPPFAGGLVGYFAYDYVQYGEPSIRLSGDKVNSGAAGREDPLGGKVNSGAAGREDPLGGKVNSGAAGREDPLGGDGEGDNDGFRDVDLMLFDKVIAFDRLEGKIILIANFRTDAPEENYNRAVSEIEHMRSIILDGEKAAPEKLRLTSDWRARFDHPAYCSMVLTAKRHIIEGDIFQVVLSNRLECDAEGSLFETYRLMSGSNPSPYMFYFSSDDIEIAGAAPETLVKLRGDVVSTFPLAGTRGRGATPEEDAALEADLLSDVKELAEHNMLVDLGRNDIGRVSKTGTVAVRKYLSIERFSHVMHIGSTVEGEIRGDRDAVDAITALLPAGTLSGAPKIRACQIIGELEGKRRGVYGGAVGYIGLNGDMDTCIAIRIAYKKNGRVFIQSGAGIVADSVPENEYEECRRKLGAVVKALEEASKGAA